MLRENADLAFQPGPPPLHLPEVRADTAAVLNRLVSPREPFAVVVGGRTVTLTFGPTASPGPDWLALPFTVAGAGCRICMPERLGAWAIAPLEAWPQEPDPQAFALLFEFAVLDLLTRIEAAGFAPITCGAGAGCAEPVAIGMHVMAVGEAMPLVLELPRDLAVSLIDQVDRLAPVRQSDPAELRLLLSVEAGRQELTPAEICSLRPGDVVMLDRIETLLTLVGGPAAPLRRSGEGFVLDGHFAPVPRRAPLSGRMDGMDALDDVALDALPLTVVLEFQRLAMTFGEVRALVPGSIVGLPVEASGQASVDLVVNGARIGIGELVSIGGGTGVRIVRLASSDETMRL